MTTENAQAALKAFTSRVPFRPFLLEFVNGTQLRISHPEAARFREEIIVYVSPQKEFHLFDSTSVCQLLDPPTP